MSLQDWMKVISVDDRPVGHPRVWQDRLSADYREPGLQIIETSEGHHVWRYEGNVYPQIGLNAVAGKQPRGYGMDPVRFDQMMRTPSSSSTLKSYCESTDDAR